MGKFDGLVRELEAAHAAGHVIVVGTIVVTPQELEMNATPEQRHALIEAKADNVADTLARNALDAMGLPDVLTNRERKRRAERDARRRR